MGFLRNITATGSTGVRSYVLPPVSPATPAGKRRALETEEASFAGQSADPWQTWLSEETSQPGVVGLIDEGPRFANPATHQGTAPQQGGNAGPGAPPAKKKYPAPPAGPSSRSSSARRPPGFTHKSPPSTVLTGPLSSGPDRWHQAAKVKFSRGSTPTPGPQTARPSMAPMAQTTHGAFARASWTGGAATARSSSSAHVHRSASAPPPPGGDVTPVGDHSSKVSYFSDKRPGSRRRAAPAPLILPGSPSETTRRRPINRVKPYISNK